MNRNLAGANLFFLKTVCVAMCLVFLSGLFAAGILANAGCNVKCCCQSQPMGHHHNPGKHLQSSMGCCSGSSQMPCDLKSSQHSDFPIVFLGSVGSDGSSIAVATKQFTCLLDDRVNLGGSNHHRDAAKNIHSRPLYLQNLIFLI
jgi:hypothetical protein